MKTRPAQEMHFGLAQNATSTIKAFYLMATLAASTLALPPSLDPMMLTFLLFLLLHHQPNLQGCAKRQSNLPQSSLPPLSLPPLSLPQFCLPQLRLPPLRLTLSPPSLSLPPLHPPQWMFFALMQCAFLCLKMDPMHASSATSLRNG